MADAFLRKALWRVRIGLERAGRPGAAALAVVLLCAAYAAFAVVPALAERNALAVEIAALEGRVRAERKAPRVALRGEPQLRAFYDHFPPLASASAWLARIYGVADRSGIVLTSGEYRLVDDRDMRLARYELTLPVRGSYRQVRAFVAGILGSVPPAALEEITFKRDAVDRSMLDVRVRLTLYLGKQV